MKIKIPSVIIMILLPLLILCRCSKEDIETTPLPDDLSPFQYYSDYNSNDVNQSIKLIISPYSTSTLKVNHIIELVIENVSSESISFPVGWDIKIYEYHSEDSNWYEIENRGTFSGDVITLDPKGSGVGTYIFPISVLPSISRSEETMIRVFVSGTIISSNKPVVAYVELTITP